MYHENVFSHKEQIPFVGIQVIIVLYHTYIQTEA